MSDDAPASNVGLQQSMLNSQISASQNQGDGAGSILEIFFRMFGIGKLDFASGMSLGSVFSGLSIQGKSVLNQFEGKAGFVSGLFSAISPIQARQVEHAQVDTNTGAGGGGGGDAQFASLNTIPSSQMPDIPISAPMQEAIDISPPPRTSGRSERGSGGRNA